MYNYYQCNGENYVIQEGDTLYSISRKYHVPMQVILRANPFVDIYNLRIGSRLCIPKAPPTRPMPPQMRPPVNQPMGPGGMPSSRPPVFPEPR